MRKRYFLVLVLSAILLFIGGVVSAAQWANPELLLDAEAVAKNIEKPDWVVVDCRDLKKYAEGHIPGSISFGKDCGKAFRDPTNRVIKDASYYEALLGKVGIGNNTHVVFYHSEAADINAATVPFWVMEYLGHEGKTHVLNGGIDAWRKAGKRLEKEPTMKSPATFKAKINPSVLATTEEIVRIAKGELKGIQLIDSRTKDEHIGADIRAIRGGHVPNTTINVSHKDTLDKVDDPKTGKKKETPYISPGVLEKHFGSLDRNKRTIAYCQTGTRSTLTYLQLRLMGFKDPANWDDSWRVYGSHYDDYPIEAPNGEQWFEFARIKNLEDGVKKLEEKLKKLEGEGEKK